VGLGFKAATELPLRRQLVGGPQVDRPRWRVARRLADIPCIGDGDGAGGGIDVLARFEDACVHQGQAGEDLPALADAAGGFEFDALGAALFGQDGGGRFEVAIAFPVLGRLV
jgi:hypothetical protein